MPESLITTVGVAMWIGLIIVLAGLCVWGWWVARPPSNSEKAEAAARPPIAKAPLVPRPRAPTPHSAPQGKGVFHWPGKGDFHFEVVGESHYQRALASLAGDHGDAPADALHTATLVLDDANQHDDKAVAVRIGNQLVGYLPREDARSFRRRLAQKKLAGQHTTCDAMIIGGGLRKGQRYSYGVALDIKPFG